MPLAAVDPGGSGRQVTAPLPVAGAGGRGRGSLALDGGGEPLVQTPGPDRSPACQAASSSGSGWVGWTGTLGLLLVVVTFRFR